MVALSSDKLYFEFYGDQLAYERIVALIDEQKKWEWVGFVVLPLLYLLKFFFITCVLLMGTFIAGYKVKFTDTFTITVLAEFVFMIPVIIKLIWFGFFSREYSLQDLLSFSPLSLESLVSTSADTPWIVPLVKSVNIFEFAHGLLLGYGLYQLIKGSLRHSMMLVVASYGSAWIIWQVFMIFLLINLS